MANATKSPAAMRTASLAENKAIAILASERGYGTKPASHATRTRFDRTIALRDARRPKRVTRAGQ
jgi:hypothetical protein